jgi:hypothetical protein
MPDVNRILQVEMGRQRGEISCIVIHIVTGTRLRRAAVPPPIVRNDPIPLVQEEHHLGIPVVCA